jgi:metal-responsive CopG/Arc/MetJ family transcriptional regulator
MSKLISMRLPDELLEQVDERAKKLGINRTQWYENMTRWVLVNTFTTDKGIQMGEEARKLAHEQAQAKARGEKV